MDFHRGPYQVQGQIILKCHGTLSSGLAHYPFSEFELVADEIELTDSTLKVYDFYKRTSFSIKYRT